MRRGIATKRAAAMFAAACLAAGAPSAEAAEAAAARPKYVFLFIGDGMSTPQRMLAEEFSRKTGAGPLAINALPCEATLRTCSTDSLVTDSAAAGTAIACGVKTYNHAIGVGPDGKRVESCAEVAKKRGMKVGMVTTVTANHATPAAFYAHRKDRGQMYEIALDLADSGFDLFAGGGLKSSRDKRSKCWAEHGDACGYIEKKGYRTVKTRKDFMALKPGCGKIFAPFADGVMQLEIDRKESGRDEPTLAEMTEKAIELLDNDKGFFVMIEGGRIDWAGHANDAASNIRETIAMDDAVKVALKFLDKHPGETLVTVTGDHETGGLSMGCSAAGYALYVERLAAQTMSLETFARKARELFLKDGKIAFKDVQPLIERAFSLKFSGDARKDPLVLSKRRIEEIKRAFEYDLGLHRKKVKENEEYDARKLYRLGQVCRTALARKAGLEWGSGNHTALPVMATSTGVGAERLVGFMEIEEYGRRLLELCGAER